MAVWLAVVLFALGVFGVDEAHACAPAPHEGEAVSIFDEEAVIVWDAEHKTQHFIRRAAFDTKATDFGFLVPTPGKPELAEADDEVFRRLGEYIAPAIEWQVTHPVELGSWVLGAMRGMEKGDEASAAVEVLSVARVAGYDAVVLQADDADALADWLKKHRYEMGQDLSEWLKPYVAAKWKITAFKIAKTESGGTLPELGTKAVRMSFAADKPFFPYREPASQRALVAANLVAPKQRRLRVFVLAPTRVDGRLDAPEIFPGKVVYARNLERADALLAGALPKEQMPQSLWLTAFDDSSSPRPGVADVFFEPARDQSKLVPPPIKRIRKEPTIIPLDLVLPPSLLLAGVGLVVLLRRRRKSV